MLRVERSSTRSFQYTLLSHGYNGRARLNPPAGGEFPLMAARRKLASALASGRPVLREEIFISMLVEDQLANCLSI
jgi:hypothetical protein